ncbi:FGGY-family carbohydrate kinase [Caballeronia ptereochthonis]|uniref:Xylulokinase n=1 Tax=Caballeronia ptereochthonis TaxID=1777144 RepID=A0A158AI97_9BURK|nr:FGGY family carbohydrate kinase [Caballeronia ptereochthonis]SAK57513.1 xylulokinase [Caballeronia ptereochthonis]
MTLATDRPDRPDRPDHPEGLVCGIDVGSTNVKVTLVDKDATTVWTKALAVPRVIDEGRPATDALALVSTLEAMIIEGWSATGAVSPLLAIAVTGVGEDGVPVASDLRPLDLAIPWFDRRAEREALQLRAQVGECVRAGVAIDFSRTAAKWKWLRQHRPEVARKAHLWLALTDFPAAWWSQTPFMTETLAARTACYDVFDRKWIASLLDASGALPLPRVVAAGTAVGTVATGSLLAHGAADGNTLLVAGGHDHPVAASAVRRLRSHVLVDSLGTANLMYDEVAALAPRADPYVAFSVPALGQSGVACLGVFEFAASLERFRASGLSAFLSGEVAPGEPAPMTDVLAAIDHALRPGPSTAPDRLRASVDAATFYARCMRDSIRAAGAPANPIYSIGGWARSDALLRLRASVFGEPVAAVEEDELTALGVALIAQDALGADRAPLKRNVRFIQPYPEWQDLYERNFIRFRAFVEELRHQRAA